VKSKRRSLTRPPFARSRGATSADLFRQLVNRQRNQLHSFLGETSLLPIEDKNLLHNLGAENLGRENLLVNELGADNVRFRQPRGGGELGCARRRSHIGTGLGG